MRGSCRPAAAVWRVRETWGHQCVRGCKKNHVLFFWALFVTPLCVTVDCWDGPDGEPMVQHGYTLTSKITFKSVIETINKYAFVNNECVFAVFLLSFMICHYLMSGNNFPHSFKSITCGHITDIYISFKTTICSLCLKKGTIIWCITWDTYQWPRKTVLFYKSVKCWSSWTSHAQYQSLYFGNPH